jgi:hypothetical protein
MASDSMSEPKQPSRFEKKKNMSSDGGGTDGPAPRADS